MIVKSANSGEWIKRSWANPVNYDMDMATLSWRESATGDDGQLALPLEALLFFARRSERDKRRPRPSKPANAFVLEKALKAEPTGRQPTDQLLSIARLPTWASFYRHSDSWDIVSILLSLAPLIGGPLFTPPESIPPHRPPKCKSRIHTHGSVDLCQTIYICSECHGSALKVPAVFKSTAHSLLPTCQNITVKHERANRIRSKHIRQQCNGPAFLAHHQELFACCQEARGLLASV